MERYGYPATVVVVTKNRRNELRRALASIIKQDIKVEILVVDDGSVDGTHQMVAREFPEAVLLRCDSSKGYIVHRNEAFSRARAPVVFSIDDDAEFATADTVGTTLRDLAMENIGAVAIPFVNVGLEPKPALTQPDGRGIYITESFTGTAFAVKKELFLKIGGFREHFVHQGEERDFCIRMLDAGFFVRVGAARPIRHYLSAIRDQRRMHFYGRRNDVLFCWHNVPFPWCVWHLLGVMMNALLLIVRTGQFWIRIKGVACGFLGVFHHFRARKPVGQQTYLLSRWLRYSNSASLQAVETRIRRAGWHSQNV